MLDLRGMQREQKEWLARNFPNREADYQLLGIVEEVGELSRARLKRGEGIRGGGEQWLAKEKDAVGDIVIFLMGHCNEMGWDMEGIISRTWREVSKRDWTLYPETGLPPEKVSASEKASEKASASE